MIPTKETIKMMVDKEKESAYQWQLRRHGDWTENYTLARDKVITNRLTQRQSVNVPLMKQTIKTIMAKTDELPQVVFEELANDKQKEIYLNARWEDDSKRNKIVLKDIVDKKMVFSTGRSHKKLNIRDGRFVFTIEDSFDILNDRYGDPTDIDSYHYFCHQHIFRRLADMELNPFYDLMEVTEMKKWFASEQGLMKSSENSESLRDKNERMRQMGVVDIDNPQVGETVAEINEHYIKIYDSEEKLDQYYLVVTGLTDKTHVLMVKPLEEVIGVTFDHYWRDHLPFSTWADDLERVDYWSDSISDIVRTPNKVVNSWIAQLVENRTLRNFNPHFYDATAKKTWTPQTFEAMAWGFYPVPGDPNKLLKPVQVNDLSESMDELKFLMDLVERATAATAIQQGATEGRKVTLGEVQLAFANAQERISSISKFYIESWQDFATRYYKMLEAAGDKLDPLALYKKSYKGNMFKKVITSEDHKSSEGYNCKVISKAEQEERQLTQLQTINVAKDAMPDNVPLQRIYKKRLLDIADLPDDEAKEVMDYEAQKEKMMSGEADAMGGDLANRPKLGANGEQVGPNTQKLMQLMQAQGGGAARPAMAA
jgi:hypothetical protein